MESKVSSIVCADSAQEKRSDPKKNIVTVFKQKSRACIRGRLHQEFDPGHHV